MLEYFSTLFYYITVLRITAIWLSSAKKYMLLQLRNVNTTRKTKKKKKELRNVKTTRKALKKMYFKFRKV